VFARFDAHTKNYVRFRVGTRTFYLSNEEFDQLGRPAGTWWTVEAAAEEELAATG
jgi:hypothetical protein